MQALQLLGTGLGLAFLSGINLYAAVLMVGLGNRFGIFELTGQLESLAVLSDPTILTVTGVLFAIEFLADKFPWIDSIWDSIHTVVRPIGAAAMGVTAMGDIGPAGEVLGALVMGGVGLTSHSTKASTRLMVNQSPEPFSNIVVSLLEDLIVVGGAWFAVTYPVPTAIIVVLVVGVILFFFPKLLRQMRFEIAAFGAIFKSLLRKLKIMSPAPLVKELPKKYSEYLHTNGGASSVETPVYCFTGKGVKAGRNRRSYLFRSNGATRLLLIRRWKIREHEIEIGALEQCEVKRGIFFDRLTLNYGSRKELYKILKGQREQVEGIVATLESGGSQTPGSWAATVNPE